MQRTDHAAEPTGSAVRIAPADHTDLPEIIHVLGQNGLPEAGLGAHDDTLVWVARDGEQLVGTVALEVHGVSGLLRSVAVDEAHRHNGIGKQLTDTALSAAHARGLHDVYLLTSTAERFFEQRGFTTIDRAEVPTAITECEEFACSCCDDAVSMTKRCA